MTEFRHLLSCPVYNLLFKNGHSGSDPSSTWPSTLSPAKAGGGYHGNLKTHRKHAATLCYNTPLPSVTIQLFSVPKVVCIYHVSLPGPLSPNTSLLYQHPMRQGGQGKKGGQHPSSFSPSIFFVCSRQAMRLRGD